MSMPEQVTLVGELVDIQSGVDPGRMAIRQQGREIACFYPATLQEHVSKLSPGAVVEVTGDAVLGDDGRVARLTSLSAVGTISTERLSALRLEHNGSVYVLKQPLILEVEYLDELWVYRNESINLWGHGSTREAAWNDLQENFAFLWRELAKEDDAILDSKAREIKGRLLLLAEEQAAGV